MLLEQLRELGAALPVSATPTTADAPLILSGLVRYIETGSLEPPVDTTPTPATVAVQNAEQSRIAELETEVAERDRQLAAREAGPAEVAPAPVEPAPEPAPAAEPAAPVPTTPAAPVASVDPVAAVPSAPAEGAV